MKLTDFQDAKVTVMGLGSYLQGSGIGATKWLIRHGAQTVITDLKTEEDLMNSIREVMKWFEEYRWANPDKNIYHPIFVLGQHRAEDFTDVDFVVQNPGVPRESQFLALARANNIPVLSDTAIFFSLCPHPIFAVTGTRGKTTTTTIIGEIFKRKDPRAVVAGNLKVSPLEFLDEILVDAKPRPIALELSSWMLDLLLETGIGPQIGVLTNVFPDHLNRYASFDDYKKSKELIFRLQTSEQIAILNYDQELVREMEGDVKGRLYWFSKSRLPDGRFGAFAEGGKMKIRLEDGEKIIMNTDEILLRGEHNLLNCLAAALCAYLGGAGEADIKGALASFKGLPDRQEFIRELKGIKYVNDTTATSPDGTIAALNTFGAGGAGIVLIAGGSSKKTPYAEMAKAIQGTCKILVLLPGEASQEIDALTGENVMKIKALTMKEAVEAASRAAATGDIVLLSPGAASFASFKNEYDRGDQFKQAVSELK